MTASTTALFNALAAIPVLTGLNLDALTLLAEEAVVREFGAGERVVREGESGHSFFILMEGDVKVIKRDGNADSVILATLRKGDFFGEMCIVEPMPRAATICTLCPVTVIEINAATLYRLYQKMPDQYAIVLLNLARDLARRLRSLDEAFMARSS